MPSSYIQAVLLYWGVWVWDLGVRVRASSLFDDEKFAIFDFGVRGSPKILKVCLGVPPKMLSKVGCCLVLQRAFACAAKRRRPSRQIEAGAALGRRQKPFAAPDNTPGFLKDWGETPKQISKI